MSVTDTARTICRVDSVRPFAIGAGGFVLLGVGHLAFATVAALSTQTPQQHATETVMRESTVTLLGLERTVLDVFDGLSITMALFAVACGLLTLAAIRHAPTLVQRRTAFGWITLAVSLAALAVSVQLLPPPPIVVLTVTSCAFALSLRRATP